MEIRGTRGAPQQDLRRHRRPASRKPRAWLVEVAPDRSQRNESGLRLFLTPLLDPVDRRTAYERDLDQVRQDLAALLELRGAVESAAEPEVFAPQVELGVRINNVLDGWLREQIAAAGPDGPQGAKR